MPEMMKTPKTREEAEKMKKSGLGILIAGAIFLGLIILATLADYGAPTWLILVAGICLAYGTMQYFKAKKILESMGKHPQNPEQPPTL